MPMSGGDGHAIKISVRGISSDATIGCSPTNRGPGQQPDWTLVLTCGDDRWVAAGTDVFTALRQLMRVAATDEVLVGVAGPQPNAWSSGMQRDMGSGLSTYLLTLPRTPHRPPQVPTLTAVDLALVGTVEEQDAFHANWLGSLGDPAS
jgi:hypothetical protein